MNNLKGFSIFNESADVTKSEKVVLASIVKKSDWFREQKTDVKNLLKRIAGNDVKVVGLVKGTTSTYTVETGDAEISTLEVPLRFLLAD